MEDYETSIKVGDIKKKIEDGLAALKERYMLYQKKKSSDSIKYDSMMNLN